MKIKSISSLLLCCLLLVSLGGTCGATATYQITESQLTQLEQDLTQLEKNNQQQEQQLEKVNQLLQQSNNQITLSDQQIVKLNQQLAIANNSINRAQIALQETNKSFEILEKAEKAKIRTLTLQRDILIVGIIAIAFKK